MTLAFGTYKQAKMFEWILTFTGVAEIVVRNNSTLFLGPGVLVDDDFLTKNTTVFRVSNAEEAFRFESPTETSVRVVTFVPDEPEFEELAQELIGDGFFLGQSRAYHYFLRSLEEIRPKLQDIQSVSLIGSIPYGLVQELHKCPHIKKISLDLSVKYGDKIVGVEIQELLRGMPWLERIHIHDTSYHYDAEPLDLSVGLPKFVQLTGNLKICGTEGWSHVEQLELYDFSIPTGISSFQHSFFGCLTSLNVLVLCKMECSMIQDLGLASVTELRIEKPRNVDRTFCVNIGRLLRRNRLKKLVFKDASGVNKRDFLYALLPLLEGSNTSLEELDLSGTNLSTQLMYFMEDVIIFCPTIRKISGLLWSEWLQCLAERRNNYAAVKSSLQTLLDAARPHSVLTRCLEIVNNVGTIFRPTYHRRNRKWHRTGFKELVSTPLEFL